MEGASPGKPTHSVFQRQMCNDYKTIAHSFRGSRGCFTLVEKYLG